MPTRRFFVDHTHFSLNKEVNITDQEAHHLSHVMRIQRGEEVELINGQHQLAKGKVLLINKHSVRLQIQDLEEKPPPRFRVILCQAICRLSRLDTILEKGTELGMTELCFFPGELSEKKSFTPIQWERMRAKTISAVKQCGRFDLPLITFKPPLQKWTASDLLYPAYFGDLDSKASLLAKVWEKTEKLCFFIGPESGFTELEERALRALHVIGVKLHSNILRTDTAPLVALSLAHHLYQWQE
jgi:16S rRNA (uracil1498-N3)-methyltransferase